MKIHRKGSLGGKDLSKTLFQIGSPTSRKRTPSWPRTFLKDGMLNDSRGWEFLPRKKGVRKGGRDLSRSTVKKKSVFLYSLEGS